MMTDTAHAVTEMATTTVVGGEAALGLAPRTTVVAMIGITGTDETGTMAVEAVMMTGETLDATRPRSPLRTNVTAERCLCSSSRLVCALAN